MSNLPILKQVASNFDWKDYVESHFSIKYASNGELRINCPSCGDSKFKCYVNTDKGLFNCFKCDFKTGKYDVFDFVARTEDLSKGAVIQRLLLEYRPTTPDNLEDAVASLMSKKIQEATRGVRTLTSLPNGAIPLKEGVGPEFWAYLTQRGFTKEEILGSSIHYIPANSLPIFSKDKKVGDIGRRVMWPIYGADHKLVSWNARTIDPNYAGPDKYLNAPDSDQSKTFWPYVRPHAEEAVLVEGIIDATAVRRVQGVSAYACFGKHVSKEQVAILKSWGVKDVVIFFDKRDAKKEIIRNADELNTSFRNVYVLWQKDWPKGIDAGDCLKLQEGTDMIRNVLQDRVLVGSLRYAQWKLEY